LLAVPWSPAACKERSERATRHPQIRVRGSGQECPLYTGLGENAWTLRWEFRGCRGPFGFAQGRLFDYVAASLREAATPLRMTFYVGRAPQSDCDEAEADEGERRERHNRPQQDSL